MTRRLATTVALSTLALVWLADDVARPARGADASDAGTSSSQAASAPSWASTERSASPKPALFGWLTEPVRRILDPQSGGERSQAHGAARQSRASIASAQKRTEANARETAAGNTSGAPEAPLPIATRTLPSEGDPSPAPSQPESVVATRFVGSPDRRAAEAGESGLSREPVASHPGVGPEGMSVEQLLNKGASSLQVNAVSLAGNYFREAIAESPGNPQVVARAGILALKHNRPELAVDLVEPAIAGFGNNDCLRQVLAMAKYRRGEYLSARALLQQALAIDKSSAISHYMLGCTLVKLDQRESAENHLLQAAQLDPKYASPR
jgi:tetratricopeptide (TPR) repeat protein